MLSGFYYWDTLHLASALCLTWQMTFYTHLSYAYFYSVKNEVVMAQKLKRKKKKPSEDTQNNKEGHGLDCIFLLELLL